MKVTEDMQGKKTADIWIISEGRIANLDLSNLCKEPVSKLVTEYKISELARYLLNPGQVAIDEKVVGCKVRYRSSSSGSIKRLVKKILPGKKASPDSDIPNIEEITSKSKIGTPAFTDEDLNAHFVKISDLLRPYDPVQKKLEKLDSAAIEDITAICEDIGANRYQLNLQGNINDKINYIKQSISRKVRVVLGKVYLSRGLFEMRGFNFRAYNTHNYYRLIKFVQNNRPRYCVLDAGYKLEYWVEDNSLVNFMHVFEQSVKTDSKLREALALCVKGEAKPLKLFFSEKLEHEYSEKHLPMTYRKVFGMYDIKQDEKEAIANILNNHQRVVSFNYVPQDGTEKQKLFINISVLHDMKALESIKNKLPLLYSEIDKKAPPSDVGKLYLLDSMRGFQYV
ncbi:MAG: hypothetical protein HZB61_09660 [Nitrospirae bacterium]|nr:hypothetical protein [Nitrospirota bacterium]